MTELNPEFKRHLQDALTEVSTDGEAEEVTANQKLVDLGLDSICLSEMIMELEERLDVTIDDDDLDKLETFGELQEFVMQRQKEKA